MRQKHGSLSVMKLFQFKNLICAEKKKMLSRNFYGQNNNLHIRDN